MKFKYKQHYNGWKASFYFLSYGGKETWILWLLANEYYCIQKAIIESKESNSNNNQS